MVDLDVFLNGVLPIAKGCPEPIALRAIREACIKVCKKTRQWRGSDTLVTDGTPIPQLVLPPDGAVILDVVRADFNGRPLDPKTPEWLDENEPLWRYGIAGQPLYITQETPGELILAPHAAGQLKVWVSLRPTETAQQVPDFLYEQYKDLVCSGALAELLLMAGQSFYNPDLAMAKAGQFSNGLDDAGARARHGQQKARTRTRASLM